MVAAAGQAWLVKQRAYALHRRVGRWLLLLPPIIVLSGLKVVEIMLQRNRQELRLVRFKFAVLDVSALGLFLVFIVLAIVSARRRQIALHLRWMACSAILGLEPALERLLLAVFSVVNNFEDALYLSLLGIEALLCVLILGEWRAHRVRTPYPVLRFFFSCCTRLRHPSRPTRLSNRSPGATGPPIDNLYVS